MKPTERFSSRVAAYLRARPGYPQELAATLAERHGLTPQWAVADIGSGTGLLTQVFLRHGCPVYGVEPNAEMRAAGEAQLRAFAAFRSVDGAAEATGLPAGSVDLVCAGQAAHWFDRPAARAEFARILRPGGLLALVWNERQLDESPFHQAYEQLLRSYGIDYGAVSRRHAGEPIEQFFAQGRCDIYSFPNPHRLDRAGLVERLRSNSYIPEPGDPAYPAMIAELEAIFDRHQRDGSVELGQVTRMYVGRI